MDPTLLSLEQELVHNIRRHTLNGREYVVADVVMLKEGVLNGSKGPLYYPPEEIAKRPGIWNGFPLTANHPSDNLGNPISARSPQAWQKFTIGHVFNDSYNENTTERKAEAWFDVDVCNKINPDIIPAVLSGKKINVSTGLFTSDEKIDNTRNHKGKEYQHIARNYQPDHLAVLLNDLGACSVKDGCGINLNTNNEDDLSDNAKAKLEGGLWKTVNGQHIYFKGGKAIAGGTDSFRSEINSGKHGSESDHKNSDGPEKKEKRTNIHSSASANEYQKEQYNKLVGLIGRSSFDGSNNWEDGKKTSLTVEWKGETQASADKIVKKIKPLVDEEGLEVKVTEYTPTANVPNKKAYRLEVTIPHLTIDQRLSKAAEKMHDSGALDHRPKHAIPEDFYTNSLTLEFHPSEIYMRKDLVAWLTTNCECWKGKDPVLNDEKSFSEDELRRLKDNAEASTLAVNTLKKIGTELKIDTNTTLALLPEAVSKAVANAKTMSKETELTEEEKNKKAKEGQSPNMMNKEQVTNAVKEYLANLNEKERIDLIASPTVNALIKTGEALVQEKKVDLIKALTANITNDEAKKQQILKLNKKSLEELKDLHELVSNATVPSTKTDDERVLANYFGAQGGANNNKPTYDRNDVLMPTLNTGGTSEDVETVYE